MAKAVTPGAALQSSGNREAGLVEIVEHEKRHGMTAHSWSTSSRAAVTDMPLVDMIARSYRSASCTASNRGMKPSFSMNRIAPKRCSGPKVG